MVTAGFAVYDTMKFIKSPITTICMGMAMSFGAVLLAAGTKGKRFAFVHSRIMIHQPLICGLSGTVSDVNIETNELIYIKEKLSEIIAKHTKRTIRQVSKDVDRNCYMSAYEAKKYGLIDSVVTNLK
jgi:ATP-dependent Clp protease protease subunit